jgi:hypothetical protein
MRKRRGDNGETKERFIFEDSENHGGREILSPSGGHRDFHDIEKTNIPITTQTWGTNPNQ